MSILNLLKPWSKLTIVKNWIPKVVNLTKEIAEEYSKKIVSEWKNILNIQDSNGRIFVNTTPWRWFKLSDQDTNYLNNLNKNADDFIQKPNWSTTTKNTTADTNNTTANTADNTKKTTTDNTATNTADTKNNTAGDTKKTTTTNTATKNTTNTAEKIAEESNKIKSILKRNPRLAKYLWWTWKVASKWALPLTIVTWLYDWVNNINHDLYDISEDKTTLQNAISNLHLAVPDVLFKWAIETLWGTADLWNLAMAKTIWNAVDWYNNLFWNKESSSVEHDELIYNFFDKWIADAKNSAKAAFDWFTSAWKVDYKDAKKNYLTKEWRDEEWNLIPKEKPAEDLKTPEQMADDMRSMKDIVWWPSWVTEEFKPIQVWWDKGRTIRQTPEWKYVFKSAVNGKDRSFDTIDEAKKAISTWIITHKKKELQDKLPNIKTEEELLTQMTSTKQALLDRWFSEWEIKNILWY